MSYLREHDEHVPKNEFPSYDVIYLSSWVGSAQIEICDLCGYHVVVCVHEKNTWHDAKGNPLSWTDISQGYALLCDLCGADGT